MLPSDYIFEKACYPADALASLAEEMSRTGAESGARRDVSRYLHVAIRHAILALCSVCRARLSAEWVLGILRGGGRYWSETVKVALADSLSGPSGQRAVAGEEVLSRGLKTLAALLDLRDALRKNAMHTAPQVRGVLAQAFNGATKVISTVLDADWSVDWPMELEETGRDALSGVLAVWNGGGGPRPVSAEELAPLDEAALVELDPDRSPEVDRAEEQRRRRAVTEENYISGDLVVPPRYLRVDVERLADSPVAAHRECVAYAREPKGCLVLRGPFRSGFQWIHWAIGRFWFVERLQAVEALDWHVLVENNVVAQRRSLWNAPHVLLHNLVPICLEDGSPVDPGYADRLLAHRLEHALPTVLAAEFPLEELNLRSETLARIQQARTVELPTLMEPDLASLGMEL